MGRRSNWIWNRTVKESRRLQEPEIGLRNALHNSNWCKSANTFSCSLAKGRGAGLEQGEGKVGKAGKSPTSGDQVAGWLLHSQHLFTPFRSHKKPHCGPKSSALGVTNWPLLCTFLLVDHAARQGGVSSPRQRVCGCKLYWKEEPGWERCTHDPRGLVR